MTGNDWPWAVSSYLLPPSPAYIHGSDDVSPACCLA